MAIQLISGPANSGKAQVLFDTLRAQLARGAEPLLVVPTRADAEYYLRELTREGPVLGLRIERFDGLVEEIVGRARVSGPALSELAQEQLLAKLALSTGLAGARTHSPGEGLLRALAGFVAELQLRGVSPQRLRRALAQWATAGGGDANAAALAQLYQGYTDELASMGRQDLRQRAMLALDALRRTPALWGQTPILLYGFDSLGELQLDVIETLGRVVDASVTVSLTYERGRAAFAGRARTFAALEPLAGERRALAPRAEHYAPRARRALSHLERSLFEPDAARADPGEALALLEATGERAELELLAGEIRQLLDGGMPADEIAVATRSPELIADLLEEVFAANAIPFALQRRRRLHSSGVGRALIGLLRCVPRAGASASEGELGDLLAWLRAPGLLERPQLADSLELAARRSGAVSADAARALWESRNWPLERIERMRESQERGPRALLERVALELAVLFGAPRRGSAAILSGSQVDDARALAATQRALAELGELLAIAPELVPRDALALAELLDGVEYLGGEAPAPGMVAVLDPLALRARRVRALFLCALQEGSFPARARPHALLDEQDRRSLAEASGLVLGESEDALAAERYLLYAALSRPQERLTISWHTADDDGMPTPRSLFVDDVCDLFDASLQERRQRGAGGERSAGEDAAGPVGAGWSAHGVRAPVRDEQVLADLRARPWSASSLETWMRCPMRWFVERMLAPAELEPEGEPLARGALAHAALRETFERLRERTGSARMEPAKLELARELLGEALEQNEPEHPLSLAPERVPGARRRLHAELERYLEHAAAHPSPLEPAELELAFGFPGEGELPPYELAEGVLLRGRIDRVDASAAGEAVVYDYKSSLAPPSARWIGDGSVQVALYMLAVEALLARPAVGGFYQPLSGGDLRARGVLEEDSAIELDGVRNDVRPHAEVRELLAQARGLALTAAGEARSGHVQGRPDSCAYNGGCMFPAICRCAP